jgi:hypothetical protein
MNLCLPNLTRNWTVRRTVLANRATEQVVRNAARRSGMVPMLEDGVRKAMAGITTLDELIRVVSARVRTALAAQARVMRDWLDLSTNGLPIADVEKSGQCTSR